MCQGYFTLQRKPYPAPAEGIQSPRSLTVRQSLHHMLSFWLPIAHGKLRPSEVDACPTEELAGAQGRRQEPR